MANRLADRCRDALAAWVGGISRAARIVSAVAVLSTVLVAFYVGTNFSINTNTDDMLSADLPFRQNSIALMEAFPQLTDNIVIVIDGQNENLELSARNVPGVKVLKAEGLNVYDVLKYENLLLVESSVKSIEGRLLS